MDNSIENIDSVNNTNFNRWSIPVKWGLIIGIVSCVLATVNFMFVLNSYMAFLAVSFLIYIATVIFYGVAGAQQRKAMGGYITFKDAFQAIFIVILISSIITTIYGIVYTKFIDPSVIDRIKEGTLGFMEKTNVPVEKIDEAAEDFDKRTVDSLKPGNILFSFAKSLVVSSLLGFICALIVKKQKPVFAE